MVVIMAICMAIEDITNDIKNGEFNKPGKPFKSIHPTPKRLWCGCPNKKIAIIHDSYWDFMYDNDDLTDHNTYVEVRYCPMCGRYEVYPITHCESGQGWELIPVASDGTKGHNWLDEQQFKTACNITDRKQYTLYKGKY